MRKAQPIIMVVIVMMLMIIQTCIMTGHRTFRDMARKEKGPDNMPHQQQEQKSIGIALMKSDGTLVLDLRAEHPDGTIGDARFVYPPDHPRYQKILRHIGGISPGEKKSVPPYPQK